MSSSRRRRLPTDRIYFAALPGLLGLSKATVYRRYRPPDKDKRREWATSLDIRERPTDRALHCDAAAVEQLKLRLDAEARGGDLAIDPSPIADPLLGRASASQTVKGTSD